MFRPISLKDAGPATVMMYVMPCFTGSLCSLLYKFCSNLYLRPRTGMPASTGAGCCEHGRKSTRLRPEKPWTKARASDGIGLHKKSLKDLVLFGKYIYFCTTFNLACTRIYERETRTTPIYIYTAGLHGCMQPSIG